MKKENNIPAIGKLPPQSVELEEAILGAIMLEKDAILQVIDVIHPESFYKPDHKEIFTAILSMFNRNEAIDLLTVTNELRKTGKLDLVGGPFRITELTSNVSSSANIEYHSKIVAENYMKRSMIEISAAIQKKAYDDTSDVFDILGEFDSSMSNIANNISNGKVFTATSLFESFVDKINAASQKPDGVTGVPSGYPAVDRMTGGWQNTDLVIIAARPSMGKTDLAINLAYNAARHGFKAALFSLEMSKEQLMDRIVAIDKEIDRTNIKSGKLTDQEWDRLSRFDKNMMENILIADEPAISTISLRAKARRMTMSQGVKLIIVDYLQLMSSANNKGNANDRVSEISRSLKLVAKECNVPVIALSQLSRAVETRGGDKRPQMSDLRDSGAIEQDADIIIFPYRPQYYGIDSREDGTSTFQLMEADFAKNRSGTVDSVDLRYLGKYGKVTDWVEAPMVEMVEKENSWVKSFPVSSEESFESVEELDDENPF